MLREHVGRSTDQRLLLAGGRASCQAQSPKPPDPQLALRATTATAALGPAEGAAPSMSPAAWACLPTSTLQANLATHPAPGSPSHHLPQTAGSSYSPATRHVKMPRSPRLGAARRPPQTETLTQAPGSAHKPRSPPNPQRFMSQSPGTARKATTNPRSAGAWGLSPDPSPPASSLPTRGGPACPQHTWDPPGHSGWDTPGTTPHPLTTDRHGDLRERGPGPAQGIAPKTSLPTRWASPGHRASPRPPLSDQAGSSVSTGRRGLDLRYPYCPPRLLQPGHQMRLQGHGEERTPAQGPRPAGHRTAGLHPSPQCYRSANLTALWSLRPVGTAQGPCSSPRAAEDSPCGARYPCPVTALDSPGPHTQGEGPPALPS